jgi:hypothetical protein
MRAFHAVALLVAGCTVSEPTTATSVSALVTCGPGTSEVNGECVAPRFTILANKRITADGSPTDVFVFGRTDAGAPSTEELVLGANRTDAGTFAASSIVLDEAGTTTSFTPCTAATPGCTGPLTLTVALAIDPMTPVASIEVDLVEEAGIWTAEPCLGGGNALVLEGHGFFPGARRTIVDGSFTLAGGSQFGAATVTPTAPIQGTQWSAEFSTVPVAMPLQPGIYRKAGPVYGSGKPGIAVTGSSVYAQCDFAPMGEFEVHEFVYTTKVERMTVSFRQWCGYTEDDIPTTWVQGCVHVSQ